MSNFLAQLTTTERARLLEELNYMNLEEIRGFCGRRPVVSVMVRATRTRRREKISLPLTTVRGSLRKKLLGLVDQTGAGWNRLVSWLSLVDRLRAVQLASGSV